MGWILREREESLLRRLTCSLEESDCELGSAWFVEVGMVGK